MPTLLQINVTANWGSTGKIAEQIGQVAMSHGWESYIAYGRMMNPSKSKLIKIGSKIDVYGHYAENLFLDNEGLASRRATRRFLKIVDKIKPNIVHLHNIHDHYINYKLLFEYLAQKDIPVIWTQHDQWATTGHCMYNLCGCDRWKNECHNCPLSRWFSLDCSQRNFRLKKKLCKKLASLTIVPVSEWLADNIRSSHLRDRPIQVIHNGIDLQVFKPQLTAAYDRYNIDRDKKIVLGVAAVWDSRKGLSDFWNLARLLPKEKYVIVIVGEIIERIPEIERGCSIVYIERTQNALELARLYSSASVFINPTYQDNFPTTNLEALACGTPVITYRTGGSPEAVDAITGVVVEQGDVVSLARAIQELYDNPLLRKDCRARAETYFDKDTCFSKYIDLYNSLV